MPKAELYEDAVLMGIHQHPAFYEMTASSLEGEPETFEHLGDIIGGFRREHG